MATPPCLGMIPPLRLGRHSDNPIPILFPTYPPHDYAKSSGIDQVVGEGEGGTYVTIKMSSFLNLIYSSIESWHEFMTLKAELNFFLPPHNIVPNFIPNIVRCMEGCDASLDGKLSLLARNGIFDAAHMHNELDFGNSWWSTRANDFMDFRPVNYKCLFYGRDCPACLLHVVHVEHANSQL